MNPARRYHQCAGLSALLLVAMASIVAAIIPIPPKVNLCDGVQCSYGAQCKEINGQTSCECNSACTKEFKQTCGTDGKTYSNSCLLNIATCQSKGKIQKAHDGKCVETDKPTECPTICTEIYQPVCGTDGKTYGNQCVLNTANCQSQGEIKKASDGECPKVTVKPRTSCARPCPYIIAPICGTDGKTYDNSCLLSTATCRSKGKIQKAHDGKCEGTDKPTNCPTICPAIYLPVCGTDGKTYSNSCSLGIATCQSQGKIKKASDGACPKVTVKPRTDCSTACPLVIFPVCGTDGKTYGNTCMLGIATCRSNGEIQKAHEGACEGTGNQNDCPTACSAVYLPVCGTDGKTYSNSCTLGIATDQSQGKIQKASDGECPVVDKCAVVRCGWGASCRMVDGKAKCECPSVCPQEEYKPVCGSNGRTYSNANALSVATCESMGKITLASEGECDESQSTCSY